MTFRALLITKAFVCFVLGIFLLVAPGVLFGVLGGVLSAAGVFAAREYGAAMIGTLLLTYLAGNVAAADAKRAILMDLLVYDAIGVIITVVAILSRVLNALGWAVVAVYLLFAAWSAIVLVAGEAIGPRQEVHQA